MRPTLRAVFLVAGGFPVALVAVLISTRLWTLWLAYLAACVLLIAADALLCLPRRRLRVTVDAPETLFIGDTDDAQVTLAAPKWRRPTHVTVLSDLHADLVTQPAEEVTVTGTEPVQVRVALTPKRRGQVTFENLWLKWTGPFRLTTRQRCDAVARTIPVVPNIRAVRNAALALSSRDAIYGVKVERFVGDGSEFESLREYSRGMDPRSIDWKHSARHRKLHCKEFRAERNHQIVLAMDTGHLMSEPLGGIPKLDHAINAGLLLSYFSLRAGDRVGMFSFDSTVRSYHEPNGGLRSFPHLQQASASLSYNPGETNFTLALADLSTRLKRRSLVVVLTDFVDTVTAEIMVENIHRLSRRHLVVFVALRDPGVAEIVEAPPRVMTDIYRSVVAGDFERERAVVLRRLRNLGIHCIDVPPAQVSVSLLNRYLEIKRREMI